MIPCTTLFCFVGQYTQLHCELKQNMKRTTLITALHSSLHYTVPCTESYTILYRTVHSSHSLLGKSVTLAFHWRHYLAQLQVTSIGYTLHGTFAW